MKKSILTAVIITVISILWIGSGVFFESNSPQPKNNSIANINGVEKELMKVSVVNSTAQNYTKKIKINGRSVPSKDITIRAEAEGQVVDIISLEGVYIEKNTEIVKIDIKERQERVREARELIKQRKIEHDASKKLIKQGYASDMRLAQTRSELEAARANFTRAQILLAKTTVIAPFDGVLGVRHVDIGDYVRIADPITEMVDLDPLKVTIFVNEKDISHFKSGGEAKVDFINGVNKKGIISFVSPYADQESRTFQVDVLMDNAGNELPAGLTVQVEIDSKSNKAHMISPAILTLDDKGVVGLKRVDTNNKVIFSPVEIMATNQGYMWVSGIPDEAMIVTVGQDFVSMGQVVDPIVTNNSE